jgi:hypothetical protein
METIERVPCGFLAAKNRVQRLGTVQSLEEISN